MNISSSELSQMETNCLEREVEQLREQVKELQGILMQFGVVIPSVEAEKERQAKQEEWSNLSREERLERILMKEVAHMLNQ
jgi:hypothetical protein